VRAAVGVDNRCGVTGILRMRWVRFNRTAEPPSLARLGIVLNGAAVGDLRAGYASMLHAQGDQHARDIARCASRARLRRCSHWARAARAS